MNFDRNILNGVVVDPLMGATDFSGSGRVRTWKSEVAGRTHH